jgi:hypothetical protein
VEHVLADLSIVANVARRASGRLRRGALDGANDKERAQVKNASTDACAEVGLLEKRIAKELGDAG